MAYVTHPRTGQMVLLPTPDEDAAITAAALSDPDAQPLTAEELAQRIMADRRGLASRPSLTGAGTLDEIEEILHARTPLYREAADLTIETVGKSAGQVVEVVINNVKNFLKADDILIDGGNSFYKDSINRGKELEKLGDNKL